MTEQELKECIAEVKNSAIPNSSKKKIINVLYGKMHENGWIPCSERLPEISEDNFCPEYNVTIENAEEATTLMYGPDGAWLDDYGNAYNVIAWKPLPEAYQLD